MRWQYGDFTPRSGCRLLALLTVLGSYQAMLRQVDIKFEYFHCAEEMREQLLPLLKPNGTHNLDVRSATISVMQALNVGIAGRWWHLAVMNDGSCSAADVYQ